MWQKWSNLLEMLDRCCSLCIISTESVMKLIFMNKYLHLVSGVMPGSEGSIDIIHKASAARSFGELAVLEFCHVILQSQQVRRHVLSSAYHLVGGAFSMWCLVSEIIVYNFGKYIILLKRELKSISTRLSNFKHGYLWCTKSELVPFSFLTENM